MDETGLFYQVIPDTTISIPDTTISKGEVEGTKQDKTRLTVAFTANATGTERLPPFIIGHAAKPRAIQRRSAESMGFYYRHNQKAWMKADIFAEWLRGFDSKMRAARRFVLLLLDNAACHIIPDELTNVKVAFFPPTRRQSSSPWMQASLLYLKDATAGFR